MHLARLGLLLAIWTSACDGSDADDNRFPCGAGSCELGQEMCVIGGSDQCSTCVPLPAACASSPSCECLPPASDPDFGDARCVDDGVCEDVEGGAVVICAEVDWGCG